MSHSRKIQAANYGLRGYMVTLRCPLLEFMDFTFVGFGSQFSGK